MIRAQPLAGGPSSGPLAWHCTSSRTKLLRQPCLHHQTSRGRCVASHAFIASSTAAAAQTLASGAHAPGLILTSAAMAWMVQQSIADLDSITSFTTNCGKLLFLLFLPCQLVTAAASVPLGLLPLSAVAWVVVKMACGAAAGLVCARMLYWLQTRGWPRVGRWSPYGPSQAEADIAHAAAVAMGAPAAAPALLPPVAPPPPGLTPTLVLISASAAVHAPTPAALGSHAVPALGATAASAVADVTAAVLVAGAVLWGMLLPWASQLLDDQSTEEGSSSSEPFGNPAPSGTGGPGGLRRFFAAWRSRNTRGTPDGDSSSSSSGSGSSRGGPAGSEPGSAGSEGFSGMAQGGMMEGRVWMRVQGNQEVLLSPSDLSRVLPYDTPLPGSLRIRLPGLHGFPDTPGSTATPDDTQDTDVLPGSGSTGSSQAGPSEPGDQNLSDQERLAALLSSGSNSSGSGSSGSSSPWSGRTGSSSRGSGGGEADDSSGIVIEAVVVEPVGSEGWWASSVRTVWRAATANPPLTASIAGIVLHVVVRLLGLVPAAAEGLGLVGAVDGSGPVTGIQHAAAQAAMHTHMVPSHVPVPMRMDAAHAAQLVTEAAQEAAQAAAAAHEWVPWDGELLRSMCGGIAAAVAWAAQAAPTLLVLHSAGCVASAAQPHSSRQDEEGSTDRVSSTPQAGPEGPVLAALRRVLLPSNGSEVLTLAAAAAAAWFVAPSLISACGVAITALVDAATQALDLNQAWRELVAAGAKASGLVGADSAAAPLHTAAVGQSVVHSPLLLPGTASLGWPIPLGLEVLAGEEGWTGAVLRAAAAVGVSLALPSPAVLLALHMAHTYGFLADPAALRTPLARDVQDAGALLVRLCVLAAGLRVGLLLVAQIAVMAAVA